MTNQLNFATRAASMNLVDLGNECFQYVDAIGSVVYKKLQTKDQIDIPVYAIFTKPPVENVDLTLAGYVSDQYQFEGNEVMNNRIRTSIAEVGTPIFREYVYLNPIRTRMSNEIIIQHASNIPRVGDVFPQIIVKNTYDGSGAREFLFGFTIMESNSRSLGFGFKNKLGKVRQVHNMHSRTSFSTPIGQYVEFFTNNILEIIEANFATEVDEETLLRVMDMVETVGKKRRVEISNHVAEVSKETGGRVNAWSLFVGITRFSSIEKNVNIKSLLDDIAEQVLVIPVNIANVLKTLGK